MTRDEMLWHVITHGAPQRGGVGQLLKGIALTGPRDLLVRFLCARSHSGDRAVCDKPFLRSEVFVNQPISHAKLIGAHRRAHTDAAYKSALIKAVAKKGPLAIHAAIETATKAAKRRDSYAKKLSDLGIVVND